MHGGGSATSVRAPLCPRCYAVAQPTSLPTAGLFSLEHTGHAVCPACHNRFTFQTGKSNMVAIVLLGGILFVIAAAISIATSAIR